MFSCFELVSGFNVTALLTLRNTQHMRKGFGKGHQLQENNHKSVSMMLFCAFVGARVTLTVGRVCVFPII